MDEHERNADREAELINTEVDRAYDEWVDAQLMLEEQREADRLEAMDNWDSEDAACGHLSRA